MQVAVTNDVKIYNLSAGKSLPDWISAQKRRKLCKDDVDIAKRIELIEDFEMPDASDCIRLSKDGQHLVVTGTYKPVIKCYELNNMSLKFERCTNSENVCFNILSDDYSKMIFLQEDRHVEIHNQAGKYYRFRVPKVCRDMAYHPQSCDQYFVGTSSQIFRFNLEQGRFLTPLESAGPEINSIQMNPEHGLICVGTIAGKVEGWDPRSRTRAAVLDCGLQAITPETSHVTSIPAVTTLAFRDGLNMAVGTSTGLVLLYDMRSSKPIFTKDHMYGLPMKKIDFHTGYNNDFVLSMDSQTVKIWDRETGKTYTSIEASADYTDLCLYKQSGLLFMSNNQAKMQTYYIPSLGPAPRWASFLDSLTEELEESKTASVYDDYKFVTNQNLHELGLEHLIGSPLMRAHMHGYYMDLRLYRKAVLAQDPNRSEAIKKQYVASEIDKLREKRVKIESKLPKVNAELYSRLKTMSTENAETENKKYKKTKAAQRKEKMNDNILKDDRFSSLFNDFNFQVDPNDDIYKRLNPWKKVPERETATAQDADNSDDDFEAKKSEDEDFNSSEDEKSRENEKIVTKKAKREMKKTAKDMKDEEAIANRQSMKLILKNKLKGERGSGKVHKFSEIKAGVESKSARKKSKLSLEERICSEKMEEVHNTKNQGLEVTFQLDKPWKEKEAEEKNAKHLEERKELTRSAKKLKTDRLPPKFWMGKKVK